MTVKGYSDKVLRTINNITLRKVSSSYIDIHHSLLGRWLLRQRDAETILEKEPLIFNTPPEEKGKVVIPLSTDGGFLDVQKKRINSVNKHMYGVTLSCNDQWWFSEEELKSFLSQLRAVTKL